MVDMKKKKRDTAESTGSGAQELHRGLCSCAARYMVCMANVVKHCQILPQYQDDDNILFLGDTHWV